MILSKANYINPTCFFQSRKDTIFLLSNTENLVIFSPKIKMKIILLFLLLALIFVSLSEEVSMSEIQKAVNLMQQMGVLPMNGRPKLEEEAEA